jgi:hypothetical protein
MTTDAAAPPAKSRFTWLDDPGTQRTIRAGLAAVPVLLVNAVAFIGQYGYLNAHLPWITPGKIMAAIALESIAVYLSAHAHMARLANDSAARLQLGAYSLALVIGAMNYSHYAAPHWRPTVPAVMLGLMSAISPWLWSIHSRRASRDKLMAQGLVEQHAVRLGATRWTWHPLRSTRVMHRATWLGETHPARAIATVYPDDVPAPRQDSGAPAQIEERATPAAPAIAPPAAPAIAPAPAPVTAPAAAAPAVHQASARLSAAATIPHQVPQEVIDQVELHLAGMPVDQLPSRRAGGRVRDENSDQRRLARKLMDARAAAASQQLQPPANGSRPARPGAAQQIAWPQQFRAGGAAASG